MAKKLIRLTEGDLHNIIKESVNKVLNESINKYQTYEQVENAVYDYLERKWPDRNRAGYWVGWHDWQFAQALYALGFDDDGSWYDCDAYTNGIVRVAIVWENGDGFWTLYKV